MDMAQGGVVYAANGFAGTTTATNQLGSRASSFGNTATRVQPKNIYTTTNTNVSTCRWFQVWCRPSRQTR